MWYDGIITNDRFNELKSIMKEKGMKVSFRDFVVYEISIIISQTALSDIDREIAELKYIKRFKNVEIYNQMIWDSRNTCERHIKNISLALRTTCNRIFK